MLKKFLFSFSLAIQNLKDRIFHTLLSTLGIVIGVAALVAVLSLIDGMEEYANEQITNTTSVKEIRVHTNPFKMVNNLQVEKETYHYLNYPNFKKLSASLTKPATTYLSIAKAEELKVSGDTVTYGASINAITARPNEGKPIEYGRYFTEKDVENERKVAYINHFLASKITNENSLSNGLGKTLIFGNKEVEIIGVLSSDGNDIAQVFIPITLFADEELKANTPRAIIEADHVSDVALLKAETVEWLKTYYQGDSTDFVVATNEFRVEQAAKGFLAFRLIMGFLVGISVVVGGIGVMNVLLISLKERTVEIGVRKALGAKKTDILFQFLAESVMVSIFGCTLGLILGVLATLGFVPLVKGIAEIPFYASFTVNTFVIISIIAILIGIIFGTYPALQAAKLDPVEAIRRE